LKPHGSAINIACSFCRFSITLCYALKSEFELNESNTAPSSIALTYCESTIRPICEFHKARAKATEDAVVYFNTLSCPTKFHLQSLKSIGALSHDGAATFHEDRVKFLLCELRKSTSEHSGSKSGLRRRRRLGLFSAFCGPFRIRVLGLFSITQDSNEGTTAVQKLNSLVKVERRMSMDTGSEVLVPDCLVQTDASPCDDENCLCRRSFCS
jgi:hypothetical protein